MVAEHVAMRRKQVAVLRCQAEQLPDQSKHWMQLLESRVARVGSLMPLPPPVSFYHMRERDNPHAFLEVSAPERTAVP